jgi:transcriptional regulator, XRE family|nr:MAG TPA: Repressor protein CI [Caudoviricetes sp.]
MFGNVLKNLRESIGMNQEELSEKFGISKSTIGMYETNKREPNFELLKEFANFFNVSTDYLLEQIKKDDLANFDIIQIPLLGKIQAGVPTEMFLDIIDYIDIPADMARGNKELFALKTKGKSMEPNFIEGDILIFEKTEDCETGQFCAVAVNGDDATFKKVTKTDAGIMLQPLNPDFETKFYTNEQIASLPVQIIGVLKQIRRNF